MTMEKLIAGVLRTSAHVAAAQEKAGKARGKLREALEPLLKKAMEEVNTDLYVPYRFGRHDLIVRETGEIHITLRDLSHAKDGKKCGTEIFDGREKMLWLEGVRETFRKKLALPSGTRFWLDIDGWYYIENK